VYVAGLVGVTVSLFATEILNPYTSPLALSYRSLLAILGATVTHLVASSSEQASAATLLMHVWLALFAWSGPSKRLFNLPVS
jgi:hypothetical protein